MIDTAIKTSGSAPFRQRDLTGIAPLTAEEIRALLSRAEYYANQMNDGFPPQDVLRGKVIFTLFFENSTRTLVSFEMAAKRLGAEVINWDADTSSLKKGESFSDTIQTLNAMGPDAIVIRHHEHGAPEFVARHASCPIINAGDSWREHPTQALLDALTLRQRFGKIEGLTVAICGDIAHSRVANSNMILLRKLGANVHVVAPAALMPGKFPAEGVKKFETMEDGLKGCDAVMMLRLQKERMQAGLINSEADYFRQYGLTLEKLAYAKPGAAVMHPGPMNRGIEIADDVADDPHRSLILQQVRNGVPVRMAVLEMLIRR